MMNYIKGGLKVLTGYCITLLIFGVFLSIFLSMAGDNSFKWLPVYSFVIFILMSFMMYSDMHTLAVKEKRPQYNLKPYPFKGFILGLIGFSPFILLELVYPLIRLEGELPNRIKHLALNTLLGPLYGFIKLGGSTPVAYAIAALIVPILAMLGYMSGFYGFELSKHFKKQNNVKTDNRNTAATSGYKPKNKA